MMLVQSPSAHDNFPLGARSWLLVSSTSRHPSVWSSWRSASAWWSPSLLSSKWRSTACASQSSSRGPSAATSKQVVGCMNPPYAHAWVQSITPVHIMCCSRHACLHGVYTRCSKPAHTSIHSCHTLAWHPHPWHTISAWWHAGRASTTRWPTHALHTLA